MVGALLATCVGSARAQGGRRFGGMMGGPMGGGLMLLSIPEVQQELKMTQPQIDKLQTKQQELRQAMQEIFQGGGGPPSSPEEREKIFARIRELQDKALADILDTRQQKRFRQLELQRQGPAALARKDVADELKLTEAQRGQIQTIQQQAGEAMRGAMQGVDFQNMTPEDRQKLGAKMQEIQKAAGDKITATLTAAQRAQWKTMQGEPFKFPEMGFGRPRP
jgi:hypothetical protein